MKLKKYIPIPFVIVAITFGGFLLRIANPFFGSPVLYAVPDEVGNYTSALYMLSSKTLVSLTSQYPPLGSYIQIPFILTAYIVMLISGQIHSIADFGFFLATHEGYLLFIPRILSGVFGTLSIIIIFFIARTIYPKNRRCHIWATIFFAFSLNLIQISHLGKPWSESIFFSLLSILFILKYIIAKKSKFIFFSALSIAVSFGFLQIAFYIFLLYIGIYAINSWRKSVLSKNNFYFITGCVLIICSSLFFVYLTKYKPSISFLFRTEPFNHNSFISLLNDIVKNSSFSFFTIQLLLTETVLFLFSLPFFFTKNAWKQPFLGISLYILGYFIIASLLFYQASRYMIPIIIVLPLYAAYTISQIEKKVASYIYRLFFDMLIILLCLITPMLWNYRFIEKPTYIEAKEWVEKNISSEIPIASTSVRFSGFIPSKEAIEYTQKFDDGAYKTVQKYLKHDNYPENVRNIIYLEKVTDVKNPDKIIQITKENNTQYIIDYYMDPETSLAKKLNGKVQLVKSFSPLVEPSYQRTISNMYITMHNPNIYPLLFWINRPGGYIDILKIQE